MPTLFNIGPWPIPTEVWLPVFTLLLGWLGSQITEWQRDRRQETKERKAREATKQAQIEERRTEFHRDTLLELQEALLAVARTTAQAHMEDLRLYRESGNWGYSFISEEVSEQARLAAARASMLRVRIFDDEARELANRMQEASSSAATVHSPEEADHWMAEMGAAYNQANERIGAVLRTLY